MTTELLDQVELRHRGFEILASSLGWVNAVRFVQQYESSRFNYTQERQTLLPSADAQELVRQLNALKKEPDSGSSNH